MGEGGAPQYLLFGSAIHTCKLVQREPPHLPRARLASELDVFSAKFKLSVIHQCFALEMPHIRPLIRRVIPKRVVSVHLRFRIPRHDFDPFVVISSSMRYKGTDYGAPLRPQLARPTSRVASSVRKKHRLLVDLRIIP